MQPLRFCLVSSTTPVTDRAPPTAPLQDGQRLLIWAIRLWATGRRDNREVMSCLRAVFEAHGVGEAFIALRELLAVAWHSASRPLNVAPLGEVQISPDERCLLAAVRHAEDGDLDACRRSLGVLLCPLGVRAAVLPAWGLARALASLQASDTCAKPAPPPFGGLVPVR